MKSRRSTARAIVLGAATVLGVWPAAARAQALSLDEAVGSALRSHPDLAAADASLASAGRSADAARAERLPGASLDATLTRFQEPMIVAPFHSLDFSDPPTFDRSLVQGRLGAAYTVFDGGVRSSRIDGAEALTESARHGRRATEMAVLEETVAAFVGVLSARAVLEAAQARLAALQAERDRAEDRFEAGTAAEVEVIRAAAALQDALAAEASAVARVGLMERTLARTMGVPGASIAGRELGDVMLGDAAGTANGAPPPPAPAEADATVSNPVVLRAEQAAVAAAARVSQERAGRLPTLRAGAGVLDYGTLTGDHVFEWQAGLELSWPLFTGGARSASVGRAEAELIAARSRVASARREVEQAIDAAGTAFVEAESRAAALELSVSQWEEVARIEQLALDAGSGTQADLLRAQAGLFQARSGYALARYEGVVARVRLARAEGTLDADWLDEALETTP